MRARTAAFILMLLPLFAAAADEIQQPDSELLEYLGEWAGTDKDWSDPVDILDMNFDKDRQIAAENEQ